ncbi:hypothetical protein PWR63_02745 [Paraburkholderia sp. A2WS-5]|uniref:hypothetical protein n=1 Tax=unclassified Paraburkholderia TaxID=2615204 RepID=UPI003B7F3717
METGAAEEWSSGRAGADASGVAGASGAASVSAASFPAPFEPRSRLKKLNMVWCEENALRV